MSIKKQQALQEFRLDPQLGHCLPGISRSVSLRMAFMMTHISSERRSYNKMDVYEALDYVRARRTVGQPNQGFMKQLVKYDPEFTSIDAHLKALPAVEVDAIKTIQATIGQLQARKMY